ncbi:MAG: MBL fold metallo-hydrolase [Patescibacteria group bacterium]
MNNFLLKIKKNIKKYLVIFGSAAVILVGALHIYNEPQYLEIDFLDVGQGDASLIKTPGGQVILIDGGPDNRILRRLGESLPFYERRIDYVVLSHYHEDHLTGLIEILKRYKVKNLIYSIDSPASPALTELLGVAQTRAVSISPLRERLKIVYADDCFMDILNPSILGIKKDDNNSLAARLDCAGRRFLFTGDNSAAAEKALVASGWGIAATVFKAAHHGSNSANSELFLIAVNPRLMVFSVGADNRFGHPSQKVLDRAAELGIEIKRTDQLGTIKVLSR